MSRKILIADDDLVHLRMLESFLLSEGFDVIKAVDGLEAIMKVKNEGPDLVILDVVLPEINGYDVCYHLRFNPEFKRIPIVLVTEREDELADNIKERVDLRYVRKPLSKKALIERVNELLGSIKKDGKR